MTVKFEEIHLIIVLIIQQNASKYQVYPISFGVKIMYMFNLEFSIVKKSEHFCFYSF